MAHRWHGNPAVFVQPPGTGTAAAATSVAKGQVPCDCLLDGICPVITSLALLRQVSPHNQPPWGTLGAAAYSHLSEPQPAGSRPAFRAPGPQLARLLDLQAARASQGGAPASKSSRPSAAPSARWSAGGKSNSRCAPTTRSTAAASSPPTGACAAHGCHEARMGTPGDLSEACLTT